MKPKTKNLIVCPVIKRSKQVFESEEKALRFIKYNSQDIDIPGGGVLRPYYCPACGGWHLTHLEYDKKFDERTEHYMNSVSSLLKKETKKKKLGKDEENELLAKELFEKLDITSFKSKHEAKEYIKQNYSMYSEVVLSKVFRDVNKYFKQEAISKVISEDGNYLLNIEEQVNLLFEKVKESIDKALEENVSPKSIDNLIEKTMKTYNPTLLREFRSKVFMYCNNKLNK